MKAYIALGANLGDRQANIGRSLELLRQTWGVRLLTVSSLIENPAVGGPPDSPPFLNGAAELETDLLPRELLSRLHEIERELGRVRRGRWEPRVIDLDLLLYGEMTVEQPNLRVPHPRMHERRFVLEPLAEIAPGAVHPVLRKTVAELLGALP